MSAFWELNGMGLSSPAYVARLSDVEATVCPPPCECIDCQHSFYACEEQYNPRFSYSGRISSHDAQRIAAGHVREAQQDREYLVRRLALHGDLIMNRWKKKSGEKRQKLLNDAVPDLTDCQWFLPRYTFTPESKVAIGRSQARRRQLLLPWLSVEVLKTNPAVLFGLLHNRTTYPPQDWAPYDSRQLILSWACGHFDVEFSSKCVTMYGPKYGELVNWQAGPAHRADIIGFPRARLVLEAQAYLLSALHKIVDKILEGVNSDRLAASEKWKLMIRLGFKHSNEIEFWSSYTNQAFSAPPIFNIDNLVSTAQTRLDALGDHLWLLQTHVDYMRRYIKVLQQGEYYKVIDADGVGESITMQLFMDVLAYWWWDWVKNECEHVKDVHDRFRDSIHPGDVLPPKYDKALGALELLLVNRVISQGQHIGVELPQRPGFSHKWTFERYPTPHSPGLVHVQRKGTNEQKVMFDKDPLEWCLVQMEGVPDKQTNFDHAMLFAFLENHLANSSSKEKGRVDEVLYRKLSDVAAYHEMLVSVRLHRPQNANADMDKVIHSEDRITWKKMKTNYLISPDDKLTLGKALFRDFFSAPSCSSNGKKNSTRLKELKAVRKALEDFWTGLRDCSKRMLEKSDFTPEEVSATLKVIFANLSPQYIDIVQVEERQVLAAMESTPTPASIPSQTEWGSDVVQAPVFVSKAKSKTRPAEQSNISEDVETQVAGLTIDSVQGGPQIITVTKRAFEMLTLMFPTTAAESSVSVGWDIFVYAMADMGFTARNSGGSAVVFEKDTITEGDRNGRIVFHKPHPVPKIDPVMLHSWGKRMAKWFGWHRELFILES